MPFHPFFNRLIGVAVLVLCGSLQGCFPIFFAGAATTVAVAKDRRTTGTVLDDQTIKLKALHLLGKEAGLLEKSRITPVCYNNVLVLLGQTPSLAYKEKAGELVKDIPNVHRVYNELSIEKPILLGLQLNDSWITTKIKSKLLKEKKIHMNHIKVVTENGVVYLLGLTSPEEIEVATTIARNTDRVEKVVQIFEPL